MITATYPTVRVIRIIDRDLAIAGLAQLRREWEEIADGESLVNIKGSIGLLLVDITQTLDLTLEESGVVLGTTLMEAVR